MDLQTIRTKVRRKLDEDIARFWSDEELDDYINDAYYYYWQWIIDAKNPGALKEDTLNITSGTATIALPSDFHSARLVERVYSSYTVPLEYKERFDESNPTTSGIALQFDRYRYRFLGQSIVLEPTPMETVSDGIKLTYFFIPDRLSDNSDEPDSGFNQFYHELIITKAVILAKEKEEAVGGGGADLGPFLRTLAEREQKFKESIELSTYQRFYVTMYDDCY